MKLSVPVIVLVGLCYQVHSLGTRITLDEKAQNICKKYKMMCKAGKICAMQHFDNWHRNITIPVCVPLSFVPVRSLICKYPPDPGECGARYLRWYYNRHSGECSWFTYGGCQGNGNNFKSKRDCEEACVGTGGQDAALAGMKPVIMTAPIFESPDVSKYEALNSVMITGNDNGFDDRYPIQKQKKSKGEKDRRRKRRRLNKGKRRRQLRKERKRQKRLLREKQGKSERKKRGKSNKKRRGYKKKKDKGSQTTTPSAQAEEPAQNPDSQYYKMFSILDRKGNDVGKEQDNSLMKKLS